MNKNSPYDILFEPMAIGALTAKNRFYQVPHCNGGGYRDPSAAAAMRGIKAEGGWGVIFTEQCEIHQTSEITPFIELRLWEDKDIPAIANMAERMKTHGALAGIQLAYSGINGSNLYSREVPLAPTAMPIRTFTNDPISAKAMDKEDIKNCRRWFVNAVKRSKMAGFDLVCLYGAHGFGIFQHFFSRATNHRTDEYGGSLENRSRFLRETVDAIRQEIGDEMAISLRLSLAEVIGDLGFSNTELRELISMHRDLPDIWDLAHGAWEDCSGPSRFKAEAAQQELVTGIKALTDKPVVGVGRFTSPDKMVSQIKENIIDFIGCARPSIADPFLPNKILENRIEDIRECIGCNMCITGDMTMSISRCTQNPTFMEEWRKGWHPEKMNQKGQSSNILVIGGGPAGLEASLSLARRGYDITLAESKDELGGRVLLESGLPGLSVWKRVADYRIYQLQQLSNVDIYKDSELNKDQILDFGFQHVLLTTGAKWRKDAISRQHVVNPKIDSTMKIFTPDDIMDNKLPKGNIIVFDDDHYYMGGVVAEKLALEGNNVTLVTPSAFVSEWTLNTLEHAAIHSRLLDVGVKIVLNRGLDKITKTAFTSNCMYGGENIIHECDAVVMVTARTPNDTLWNELAGIEDQWQDYKIDTINVIGDALTPGPIAWATYAGHRYARELDMPDRGDALSFKREITQLEA